MNFLDKNGFRAALVIAVLFLAMPFIFPERVPLSAQERAAAEQNKAKDKGFVRNIYDRIGGFYGFKKTKASTTVAEALANIKKEADAAAAKAKAGAADTKHNSFEKDAAEGASAASGSADLTTSSLDGSSSSSSVKAAYSAGARAKSKPVLSYKGKNYEVLKDPLGVEYAITEKGPVAVKNLVDRGGVLYPYGKNVAGSNVESSAVATGAAAKSAKYASAGGTNYKGKAAKFGSVTSTKKRSSGFGLSSSGGHGGGSSSGGGAYGRFQKNYSATEQAVGQIAKNSNVSPKNANYVTYTYSPSAEAASPAASVLPDINPEVLGAPSIGKNAEKVSIKENTKEVAKQAAAKSTEIKPLPVKSDNFDLDALPIEEKPAEEAQPEDNGKITVEITEGNTGVIPANDDYRKNMTDALLGKDAVFVSTEGKPNPWIIPTNEKVVRTPGMAFWEANKDALIKGGSPYQDQSAWKKADDAIIKVNGNIKTLKKTNIAFAVLDGDNLAGKESYFVQPAAEILKNIEPAKKIEAATPEGTIYVVKSDAAKKDIEDKYSDKNVVAVVYKDYKILPENNKKYFEDLGDVVKQVVNTADANSKAAAAAAAQNNKTELLKTVKQTNKDAVLASTGGNTNITPLVEKRPNE